MNDSNETGMGEKKTAKGEAPRLKIRDLRAALDECRSILRHVDAALASLDPDIEIRGPAGSAFPTSSIVPKLPGVCEPPIVSKLPGVCEPPQEDAQARPVIPKLPGAGTCEPPDEAAGKRG